MWLERFLSVHMTMQNGTQIVRHFRVLFKKGYTGLNSQGYPEAIVTIKKPIGRDLTQEEIATNTRIERDRVIVENYFGRLKSDFGFLRQQYSSDRSKSFPSIMAICIALNNFYISEHPLRVAHQQNQVLMNQN
ncbi:hypothetical protein GPJ56_006810 [Histomonas meleagridis]|uniref:uncharacterized protein n=1 Tax=Histomonas meleagridis TaxID=135588 RepID=UPI00355A3C31|nr:hypothetical protein GPJ56_006810 [Histomonas meleagridis]KAH0800218.1 hypothetical protein GO595_007330 [Histomonas meleagridis]